MKKSVLFFAVTIISIVLIAAVVQTTIDDFFMPGSQTGQSGNLEHPGKCDNCHGSYDQAVEPAFNWRGGMMAQAMRDPVFLACMAIANVDAPQSGNLCIRCHAPDGWLNGRAIPTDGSALNDNDREGVQCDFCHKLVKPGSLGSSPFPNDDNYNNDTYASDQEYLEKLTIIPPQSGNGMYITHDANAKRGPFVDAAAKHQMHYSPFHSESALCGTCHDVSNPVFSKNEDGTYSAEIGGVKTHGFKTHFMLPTERTYSEWKMSAYNSPEGIYSAVFGGNKANVSTCQDCHMKDVSGYGANKNRIPFRNDLPLHDMTGGNTFVPDLVADLFPNEVNKDALNAGKNRALYMLQNAATMNLTVEPSGDNFIATVEVINETGHKLPSGYPEGRRMWINLQASNDNGEVIYESGLYDFDSAELTKNGTKIYEIKLGMSANITGLTGLTNFEDGSSFHFVLNDLVIKDNRIPPRGFTNANFESIQSPVVGYQYIDGTHSDITTYPDLPSTTDKVTATLYYQTISKEYAEFLGNEYNTTEGAKFYELYEKFEKSPPVVMTTKTVNISGITPPPIADFTPTPLTGEAPLEVHFENNSNNATSYTWDFDDGSTSPEENPTNTFVSPGTYEVTLTASNGTESSSSTKTITVDAPSNQELLDIFVASISFGAPITAKGKTYIISEVRIVDFDGNPMVGAIVTGKFSGPTNGTHTETSDADGLVEFISNSAKKIRSEWCLEIQDVVKTGYDYTGPTSACESSPYPYDWAKSASIISINDIDQKLSVYPNPFSDKLYFEFAREEDTHCVIEVYGISGRKLEVIFDQIIQGGQHYEVEYMPNNISRDMLFYRIKFDGETITGKVIHQ